MFSSIALILTLVGSASGSSAHFPLPDEQGAGTIDNPYQVPAIETPITVDGILDEEAWEGALKLSLPWEYWPGDNAPAPVKTEFLLMYDEHKLYAGFRCYDPNPSSIAAHYLNRDQIWDDNDWIRIWLDTFNEGRKSFVLGSNALGVQGDGIWADASLDCSWDAIWDAAGAIHDWGYTIEMAIPFNQLTFKDSDSAQIWAITAERCYPRDAWRILGMFPFDGNLNRWLFALPKFVGFNGTNPGRNIEVNPTITSVRNDEREDLPYGSFITKENETDVGISARWGATPNITFNGTINPDFSQVEADALQLDINEPFVLKFPEKRPFFTEGADFFRTRMNALYTRSFRDPTFGFKSIGKMQAGTFGAYLVRDEIINVVLPGSRSSSAATLALENWSSVARYSHELGSGSFLGAIATFREGEDYTNRLLGLDGKFQISPTDSIFFEGFGSSTHYPDEFASEFDQSHGDFSGSAFYGRYSHDSRAFDFNTSYMDIGRGFRADTGFLPQVDIRRLHVMTNYKWLPKSPTWYWRLTLSGEAKQIHDHSGNLLLRQSGLSFEYQGPKHIEATTTWWMIRENFADISFDQNQFEWQFSFKPTDDHTVMFNGNVGDRIDYSNAQAGKRLRIEPSISSRIGKNLQLTLDHIFERLSVDSGQLYTANISQLSSQYKFNRRIFLRTILQYVNYSRDPDLYREKTEAEFKQLFMQLLFSYELNPRTVIYIGYTNNSYETLKYDLTQHDRRLFVKLGYALQL